MPVKHLGTSFVDSQGARPNARPDIRNAKNFQHALDSAVFAVAAMEADERNVELFVHQAAQIVLLGGIELADGITVGAGAVVTKSFPEPGISIAGVPAKKLG